MNSNTQMKKNAPWYRIKSRDGKEVGIAKCVVENDGTPSDWDACLDPNDPNDCEVLRKHVALCDLGRVGEAYTLLYDYASKNGKLVKRTCDFVFA